MAKTPVKPVASDEPTLVKTTGLMFPEALARAKSTGAQIHRVSRPGIVVVAADFTATDWQVVR